MMTTWLEVMDFPTIFALGCLAFLVLIILVEGNRWLHDNNSDTRRDPLGGGNEESGEGEAMSDVGQHIVRLFYPRDRAKTSVSGQWWIQRWPREREPSERYVASTEKQAWQYEARELFRLANHIRAIRRRLPSVHELHYYWPELTPKDAPQRP